MLKLLVYTFLAAFLLTNESRAQMSSAEIKSVDSLKAIAEGTSHDTIRIRAYLEWDNYIYIYDPELDLELNKKIIEIGEKGMADKAATSREKSIYARHKGQALNNTGLLLIDYGNYFEALKCLQESFSIAEYFKDSLKQSGALNNIGMIYSRLKMPEMALEYYNRSFNLFEFDPASYATYYNNAGLCYFDLNDYKRALECYDSSLIYATEVGDYEGMGNTISNIGLIYQREGNLDSALIYYEKSIEVYLKASNQVGKAHAMKNIGLSYLEIGKYKDAVEYCKLALDLGTEWKNINVQRETCDCLYRGYKKLGKIKQALEYYELFYAFSDSINIAGKGQELIKQDFQFNYQHKHIEDSLEYENQKKLQELVFAADIKEKQNTQNLLFVGIGVLLIIGGLIFRSYRLKKKDNIIIAQQKKEVELQKELVDEKNQEITSSINYAKRIQDAILPENELFELYFRDNFILYKPKDIVAGDFYWLDKVGDKMIFAVADCTGHGVPGAIVSVVCHNALNRAVKELKIIDPGLILEKTRELVIATFEKSADVNDENTADVIRDGMDIALCVYDANTKKIAYAGANNSIYYFSNNELCEIKADKQPIGNYAVERPFTSHEIQLQSNDIIFLFTDGYADQFGGTEGKKFKYKQFKETLEAAAPFDMKKQLTMLDDTFENWKGNFEQVDDVCVLAIRI